MTRFPEFPVLGTEVTDGRRQLLEDHYTEVSLFGGLLQVAVTIRAGFRTDGASIPEVLQVVAGSPWALPRLLAAIVHDALYHIHWQWRWLCDQVYRAIERKVGYSRKWTDLEYAAIRAAGWRNWNAVTLAEREAASKFVEVRTKGLLA